MAVKVRLARAGGRNRPYYRVVVADERAPRDGDFIELVGTYDPTQEPAVVDLKRDRIDYWIAKGAQTTQIVSELLRKTAKSA